jgi:hypothetical protein
MLTSSFYRNDWHEPRLYDIYLQVGKKIHDFILPKFVQTIENITKLMFRAVIPVVLYDVPSDRP